MSTASHFLKYIFIVKKRQWSQVLHETTAADFLRLTTAFVVARLGKAVVMGLVLLTFTAQFNDIEPPLSYVLLTALYFLFTQYPGKLEFASSIYILNFNLLSQTNV